MIFIFNLTKQNYKWTELTCQEILHGAFSWLGCFQRGWFFSRSSCSCCPVYTLKVPWFKQNWFSLRWLLAYFSSHPAQVRSDSGKARRSVQATHSRAKRHDANLRPGVRTVFVHKGSATVTLKYIELQFLRQILIIIILDKCLLKIAWCKSR
jgi:hypothetical protein